MLDILNIILVSRKADEMGGLDLKMVHICTFMICEFGIANSDF